MVLDARTLIPADRGTSAPVAYKAMILYEKIRPLTPGADDFERTRIAAECSPAHPSTSPGSRAPGRPQGTRSIYRSDAGKTQQKHLEGHKKTRRDRRRLYRSDARGPPAKLRTKKKRRERKNTVEILVQRSGDTSRIAFDALRL